MRSKQHGVWDKSGTCLTPVVLSLAPCLLLLCLYSCGTANRLSKIEKDRPGASIRLPTEREEIMRGVVESDEEKSGWDTLKLIGPDGRELMVMEASRDEQTGEMVATDRIDAAYVTARFRNIAERDGEVRMVFQILVPEELRSSDWQIRLHPKLNIQGDSLSLDDVLITGEAYRKAQLKGYQHYERFLSTIITDSTRFVDMRNLEIFLSRNIPAVYAYKTDSSYVSYDEFESKFGVDSQQALEHYTNKILLNINERRKNMREKVWRKYVKAPIVAQGVRLDTVMRTDSGVFVYDYVQIIKARPRLKKIELALSGEVYREDQLVYKIPDSDGLTFYVSSVGTFADMSERYLTRVISRNQQIDRTCHIDFKIGSSEVDEKLSDNYNEMQQIRTTLRGLAMDSGFEVDSIVIIASSSPEGAYMANTKLSLQRANSVSAFFRAYTDYLRDSLSREAGVYIDAESGRISKAEVPSLDFGFLSRSGGENWTMLNGLVEADTLLLDSDKKSYKQLADEEELDKRESMLMSQPYYAQLRDRLYPQLRTVKFSFHLHRKGMIKDTIHTTVLDSTYMRGAQALYDQEYEKAIELLSPYEDFNTALACVALGRNHTAKTILDHCQSNAKVHYLRAVLFSRERKEKEAVENFLLSCSMEPSFMHRGNLDPEISYLIKKYNLNEY